MNKYNSFIKELRAKYGEGGLANKPLTEAERLKLDKLQETAGDDGAKPYQSSHWDEPNILAHVRMNDRSMQEQGYSVQNVKSGNKSQVFASEAEAKAYQAKLPASVQTKIVSDTLPKKSLHLEEIQSDWHQQGRDKGYKGDADKVSGEVAAAIASKIKANTNPENIPQSDVLKAFKAKKITEKELDDFTTWQNRYMGVDAQVPDAPFKKSWHELALKRMIREAAEKGYDRLSWTPGEAQAARYDLSKHYKELRLTHNKDGAGELQMQPANGTSTSIPIKSKDDLVNAVGKDLADKLYEQGYQNNGKARLEGLDLKIGGEGMKGFYDQIIPKALEKIGKEHGVKVKSADIPLSTKKPTDFKNFEDWQKAEKEGRSAKIHYIDIPQSLRDTAMHKGFPLFSGGYQFIPVVGDPFKKDKK